MPKHKPDPLGAPIFIPRDTPEMRDRHDNIIRKGTVITYPNRTGSRMYVVDAVVVGVQETLVRGVPQRVLKVVPVFESSAERLLACTPQRETTVTRIDRVTVMTGQRSQEINGRYVTY